MLGLPVPAASTDDDERAEGPSDFLVVQIALAIEITDELEEVEDRVHARVVGVKRSVSEGTGNLQPGQDELR